MTNVPLAFYNTHSGKKEVFSPAKEAVSVYVCGPTVYGAAHIGNARPAVVFDVLRRVLEQQWRVRFVSNITDIDDKIIKAALDEGVSAQEIAVRYSAQYFADMARLGVRRADETPRATETMDEIKVMIATLLEKGNAYQAERHVLFDVKSFAGYGELSHRTLDEMEAGARVEVAPYKKSPYDFVLWKPAGADEVGWESAWGFGRPGWHIECSAMIYKTLGREIDIHAAGRDLIFPHHENERAQSACAVGGELARFWMHNEMVLFGKDKMSKSVGNIVRVNELLEKWDGRVLRLALLMTHYRQQLNWTEDLLAQASSLIERFDRATEKLAGAAAAGAGAAGAAGDNPIFAALADDLNTPQALHLLAELVKKINQTDDKEQLATLKTSFAQGLGLLGLVRGQAKTLDKDFTTKINELVLARDRAKKNKNYDEADKIRATLLELSIVLEDTKAGTTWRHQSATE